MAIRFRTPKELSLEEMRQSEALTQEQAQQVVQEDDTDIYGAVKDTSVFGEAAENMEMRKPVPGEIAQAAQDTSDAARADDTYVEELFPEPSTEPDESDQGDGAPAKEPDEPQGLFEDLGDIDTRQERERQAFADELAARKAEQQQQAEARAGLGGMGLSGATAELAADIGRQEARAGDIAMADLARRQQKETFDELRRQASIWTFEEEFGVDLDGDGNYGAPPEEVPPPEAAEGDTSALGQVAPTSPPRESALDANLVQTDETQQRGSRENPIIVNDVSETPSDARWAKDESGGPLYDENGRQLLVDSQGRYYAV
jgi:hypothetical protein